MATARVGVRVAIRVKVALKLLGSGVAISVSVTGLVLMLLSSTVMPPVLTSGLGVRLSDAAVLPPRGMAFDISGRREFWRGTAQKALGKEGYQSRLGKLRPLIVTSQSDIYRFQPDLSY